MRKPRFLVPALCALPLAIWALPAHAQMSMGGAGDHGMSAGGGGGGGGKDDDADAKKPAPPSAIPGAVATTVAPSTHNPNDLEPNAALFDAIDRGDIAAARDALGRGADLNARNLLGQRPIDLSIDLSRNDITFLLLSMRSQNGDQAPAADSSGVAEADDSAASVAAASAPHGGSASGSRSGAEFASTSTRSSSGGTAQPSAGFLGFGAR